MSNEASVSSISFVRLVRPFLQRESIQAQTETGDKLCESEKIHPLKISPRSNHLIIRVTQAKALLRCLFRVTVLGLYLALIQSRKLVKQITCQTDSTEEQRGHFSTMCT